MCISMFSRCFSICTHRATAHSMFNTTENGKIANFWFRLPTQIHHRHTHSLYIYENSIGMGSQFEMYLPFQAGFYCIQSAWIGLPHGKSKFNGKYKREIYSKQNMVDIHIYTKQMQLFCRCGKCEGQDIIEHYSILSYFDWLISNWKQFLTWLNSLNWPMSEELWLCN